MDVCDIIKCLVVIEEFISIFDDKKYIFEVDICVIKM